jgi:hypothetical protein
MSNKYIYLTGGVILLIVWLSIFRQRKDLRQALLFGSLLALPFGFTEFLFVPQYWSPPSLFNLIAKIGFGIESFLFGFTAGGIMSVIFEVVEKAKLKKPKRQSHHHLVAYLVVIIVFLGLEVIFPSKSIYNLSFSFIAGSVIIAWYRYDLIKQILLGGLFFAIFYTIFFFALRELFSPVFYQIYNVKNLVNIYIFKVPLEEVLFAFTGGACWSTMYEFYSNYRTMK